MATLNYEKNKVYNEITNQLTNQLMPTASEYLTNANKIAENSLNTTLSSLGTQRTQSQADYEENARQNYISKMQNRNTVNQQLQRLGLAGSGYGTSQMSQVESDAASNLNALQLALDKTLQGYNQQELEAQNTYSSALASNQNTYSQTVANYLQYIYEQALAAEQNEYTNAVNMFSLEQAQEQFEAEQALKEKELAAEQAYQQQQLALQKQQLSQKNYEALIEEYEKQLANKQVSVISKSSPALSTNSANNWANENIFTSDVMNNGIMTSTLEDTIEEGLKKSKISSSDASQILAWFGL